MPCDTINANRVLTETFVARVEYHPRLGSTNDRARQCAVEGCSELPLLVLADEQTAGRGRGANRWWTGRGSLAWSLLVDPEQIGETPGSRSPLVALAAAVAVVETVAPLVAPRQVGIHWPNDVMADGGKVAGILVEVLPDRRHVVGIGLNVNNSAAEAPAQLQPMVATLRDLTDRRHDRTTVLVSLLGHMESAFERLAVAPEQIAARADRYCLQHGQMLTLRQGSRIVSGRCAGIALDGALYLDTPQGRQSVHGGVLCHRKSRDR